MLCGLHLRSAFWVPEFIRRVNYIIIPPPEGMYDHELHMSFLDVSV